MDIEHDFHTHYSIDTLRALQKRFPQVQLRLAHGQRQSQHLPALASLGRVRAARSHRGDSASGHRALAALHAKPIRRFGQTRAENAAMRSAPPAIAVIDGKRNAQSATAIRASQRFAEGLVGVIPA